ncbi:MAG: LysM peptidoglycan-binding domain-containing protein [Desulfobacteraceae bacterium]|nr:LysM peptidoglycan-binding domain-containing protein [Desulfobacteraceae bacterium]
MDWKTDTSSDETEEEPYTTFKNQKSGKLIEKSEMPMILIGAGLFILIILFIVFIPKKDKVEVDDFKALVAQVSSLEQRMESIESKNAINVLNYDPAKNPVDAQQMVTWIKSNAVAIAGIIQKLDAIQGNVHGTPADSSQISAVAPEAAAVSPAEHSAVPAPVAAPSPQVHAKPKAKPAVAAKPAQQLQPKALAQTKPKRTLQVKAKPPATPAAAIHPTPSASGKPSHTVAKGDNLYRIAKQYGISVEKLQQLNGMKKGDLTIQTGRKLVVSP